jgi:hypothetical protein
VSRLPLVGFGPLSQEPNPCVRTFGTGPEDKRCKDCRYLHSHNYSKRYYKCRYRKATHGPGTDHRVGWQACAKFEEGET